jgi:hypothetical protein
VERRMPPKIISIVPMRPSGLMSTPVNGNSAAVFSTAGVEVVEGSENGSAEDVAAVVGVVELAATTGGTVLDVVVGRVVVVVVVVVEVVEVVVVVVVVVSWQVWICVRMPVL